jgi:hypothetical protein
VFDGVAVCTAGDVLLMLWQAPSRLERARWMLGIAERLVKRHPDGIVMIQLVLRSSSPPDGATRADINERLKSHGHLVRRVVTVPVGDAFWSSIVRTMMRAMYLVTDQTRRQVVAATARAGVERVREVASPHTPSRALLLARIEELYGALGMEPEID